MPFTLTRSLLVVLVPGLVALAPWMLLVVSQTEHVDDLYKNYATLIHASLVGAAIILGSMIEGALSHLEVKWDKERDEEYQVRENWFSYLAQQCDNEPVGFRYISRMQTTMYFELAMMTAAPIFLVGVSVLVFQYFLVYQFVAAALFLAFALLSAWHLYREAKCTHEVLCVARKELIARMASSKS